MDGLGLIHVETAEAAGCRAGVPMWVDNMRHSILYASSISIIFSNWYRPKGYVGLKRGAFCSTRHSALYLHCGGSQRTSTAGFPEVTAIRRRSRAIEDGIYGDMGISRN